MLNSASGKKRVKILLKLAEFYRYKSPEKVVKYSKICLNEALRLDMSSESANAKLNLGTGYLQLGKFDTAEKFYNEGFLDSKKIVNNNISGACLNGLASISMMRGKMEDALKHFHEAAAFFIKTDSDEKLAGIFSNISLIYYQKGNYNIALDFMFKALKLYENRKNDQGIGIVINSIGNVYSRLDNTKQALEYFKRSMRISLKLKNLQLEVSSLVNIGEIQKKTGNPQKAISYFSRALKVAEKLGNEEYIAICRNNIGEAENELGNKNRALKMFKLSIDYFKKMKMNPKIAVSYINIGNIYMKSELLGKAEEYFKKAIPLVEKSGLKEYQLNLFKSFSILYEKKGNLKMSLDYLKKHELLKEKILPGKTLKKISDLKIKYQSELWDKEKKIKELKIRRQKLLTLFIFTALILISLITIILYKRYKLKIRTNRELEKAYAQMEKLANYDPLTHLYNRRSMTERIEIEIVRMGRTGKPFCLIMLDIDDFKKFNDLYGHECGDKILESLSMILKESIRNQDAASRWGGEEFLVLLPETGERGGYTAAEKIRKKIEAATMEYGEYKIQFTITAGVSAYDRPRPVNDCIRAADMAMYKGKKEGKNRIIRWNKKDINHSG